MLNIAVLVSGGGTNLQALLDSEARGENPNGKITLVVASKPGVYALERAAKAGVESCVVRRRDYDNSEEFDAALLGTLAYMLLHEAVHGVCIWAYVRRRPHFGFDGGYLWTGLKDAYFDKPSYLVIALSPVVVWGVILLALELALPAWFPAICFVQSINLGGTAGDYYVAHALRSLPDETLCNDTGVAMRFYVKESASQAA